MCNAAARDEWERRQNRANGQNDPLTGRPYVATSAQVVGFQTASIPSAWGSLINSTPVNMSANYAVLGWSGYALASGPNPPSDWSAPARDWEICIGSTGTWQTYLAGTDSSLKIFGGGDPWEIMFITASEVEATSGGVPTTSGAQFQMRSPSGYYTPVYTVL